jgi:hypothetical protein
MRGRDPETRYRENIRHEQKILEDFAAHERAYADALVLWYKIKKREIPDDEYRAVVFFKNREYLVKGGSLTLLYTVYLRMTRELPGITKENAFDLLRYRYKVYAVTLEKGGFNGGEDWG